MIRTSNSLLLAIPILVGGATYAAYRYTEAHPGTRFGLNSVLDLALAREKPKPPLIAMRETETEVWRIYAEIRTYPDTVTPEKMDRIKKLVESIDSHWETLSRPESGTAADELEEAQLITVRAQFIGATTWPHELAAPFLASVENIVTTFPRTETAAQVDALRFLFQHPMDSPIGNDFLDEIDRFAETYPDSPAVISLYTAASEALMRNGQNQSAGALLRHGIQAYQDRPGLNQLINALVDQGHAPPSAPLLTAKTLAALTGARATKKQLNRRPQSSLPPFYGGFKPRGMLPGHGLDRKR